MRKIISFILALTFLTFCLSGCNNAKKSSVATDAQVSESISNTSSQETKKPTTARVLAVGDNLIHSSIYNQAKARGGDKYDFDFAYKNVENIISLADLPIINQETVIAPIYEPSDYPCFNSPPELGQKMIDLGFKAYNHSNNHILDKGVTGVESLFKYWANKRKKNDIVNTGVYKNKKDLNTVKKLTINDIVFSFIGATQHTNGIKLPNNTDIKVIYTDDEKTIKNQIELAKAESDVVVMNIHWGTENSHTVTEAQKTLAKKMVKWGADIIIGTHPHVLQSVDMIKKPDGSKAPVFYSLGNFISAQSAAPNMIGGIASMNVTKDYSTNTISISDVEFMPIINHYSSGYKNIQIYPYYMYNESLANSHGVRYHDSRFSYQYIEQVVKNNIGKKYLVKKLS